MNLSSSDWQNFIYYALLLVFLSVSLFSRRDLPFSRVLKYLSIWLVIALVIIGLYSYRYEFSDFKNRILGELNPSAAQLNEEGQITINISQDGHFYMNSEVNGKFIRFMVDTGASDISLNLRDAEKIGINIKELVFNKRYQTANGISLGARTNLKEMKIGDIRFINIPASVNSANMGVSLLGMSFLQQCKKYEFYQDKLILTFYR